MFDVSFLTVPEEVSGDLESSASNEFNKFHPPSINTFHGPAVEALLVRPWEVTRLEMRMPCSKNVPAAAQSDPVSSNGNTEDQMEASPVSARPDPYIQSDLHMTDTNLESLANVNDNDEIEPTNSSSRKSETHTRSCAWETGDQNTGWGLWKQLIGWLRTWY